MTYSVVSPDNGHVALGLAIRKLNVSGTFMQAPAHPDDETNALFALFTHGMGLRSVDVQNNRGEGGQNEIGPELFRDIGVLRTSELVAAHRIDGAEQYFTRAIDYGYSFDPEEVINKWGRDAIIGDYVRLIRTLRPDVMVTMNIQGRGGDRAHEATTVLVARGLSRGRQSGDVSGAAPRGPASVAAAQAVLQRRRRRDRRRRPRRSRRRGRATCRCPRRTGARRRSVTRVNTAHVRRAARPHLRRDRRRRAQQSQVPGHVGPAGAARDSRPAAAAVAAADSTQLQSIRRLPGQMQKDETSLFDDIDITPRRRRAVRRRESARGAHEPASPRSSIRRSARRRRSTPATTRARRRRSKRV